MTCKCGGEFCYFCGLAHPLPADHCRNCRGVTPTLNPQGLHVPVRVQSEPAPAVELEPVLTHSPSASSPSTGASAQQGTASATEDAVQGSPGERAWAHALDLLTLKCPNPRCRAAVHMDEDFDSCFSLQCTRCPTHFCAWCLQESPSGVDPHSHVLDCTEAPADMRGSSLYLQDHNGGPHEAPNPCRKFSAHWRGKLCSRAEAAIRHAKLAVVEEERLITELNEHCA
jgi:hypothetical protein